MKRAFLFSVLAAVAAVLMAMPAASQVNPDAAQAPGPAQAAPYKYEGYAGFAYTRLKQVNVSYSGLLGGEASLARDWGKYFQLRGSVDYYKKGIGHGDLPNPGDPSVYTFLVSPGVHLNLFGNLSGLLFGELGGEHTGGENMTPKISLAGGFGGGFTYDLNRRVAIRATADRLAASFSLSNNTPQLAYSTHITWDARGTVGVEYRF